MHAGTEVLKLQWEPWFVNRYLVACHFIIPSQKYTKNETGSQSRQNTNSCSPSSYIM